MDDFDKQISIRGDCQPEVRLHLHASIMVGDKTLEKGS